MAVTNRLKKVLIQSKFVIEMALDLQIFYDRAIHQGEASWQPEKRPECRLFVKPFKLYSPAQESVSIDG
jgi:hypothetical protein